MNPIDQLADERDKLKAKLKKAKAKLKKANAEIMEAKLKANAIDVEHHRALQTVERFNIANIRALGMIYDAAGIPRDADVLEWISGAKERIAKLEDSLTSIREYWNRDNNQRAMEDACWNAINTASEALDSKEAKP